MLIKHTTIQDKPRAGRLTLGGRQWIMFFARGLTAEGEIDPRTMRPISPFGARGWPYPITDPHRTFKFTVVNSSNWEDGFVRLLAIFSTRHVSNKPNNIGRICSEFGMPFESMSADSDPNIMAQLLTNEVKVFRIPVGACNNKDTDAALEAIYGTNLAMDEFMATGGAVKRLHKR